MLFNLSDQNSIASVFIKELRDKQVHTDRLRFRRNMERLGEILAYEISKKMVYKARVVETPIEKTEVFDLEALPVIMGILRAGIPFMQGFINFFDQADCGFIGAYRQEGEENLKINMGYYATPEISGRQVILVDPMLATGSSVIEVLREKVCKKNPVQINIASVIASPEGIENVSDFLKNEFNGPFNIWSCAVDKGLDNNFYIVPGLGDAGDLSFGEKVH